MLEMYWPNRDPMPTPAPMVPAPAAMPNPMLLSSVCKSMNAATWPSTNDNASMYLSPFCLFYFPYRQPLVLLVGVYCQLNVDLRQYSENVSLDYRDEDLERIEHHRQRYGDQSHEGPEIQNEAQEQEDDYVPR